MTRFVMFSMARARASMSNHDDISTLDTEVNAGLRQYLNGNLNALDTRRWIGFACQSPR
jgi:hypothetical protein